jgi:hypothetical protein
VGTVVRSSSIAVVAAIAAWTLLRCAPFSAAQESVGPSADGSSDASTEAQADSDATACDDLTSARNCGRCGRDCGEGSCLDGRCTAYPIATGQNAPFYIALDDLHVYWSSWRDDSMSGVGDGTIHRTAKIDGGAADLVVSSGDALDLVVVGDKVVFTSYSPPSGGTPGVYVAPKTGGSATPLDTSGKGLNVISDTSTGAYASIRTSGDCRIVAVQPGNPNSTLVTTFAQGNHVEGIALSGNLIYHADQDVAVIGRVQIDGGAPQSMWTTTLPSPELVIASGDDVIWTCTGAGVFSKSQSTGTQSTLLMANVGHGGLTADTDAIFAAVQNEGRVVRIDRATKATVDVATHLTEPIGITSDADAIYFVDRAAGTIYRMVK